MRHKSGISVQCATTEILEASSLFWRGSGLKGKGGGDPGTSAVRGSHRRCSKAADAAFESSRPDTPNSF